MAKSTNKWLVSTEWLAAHLEAPDLVVLDASWHLPPEKRNAKDEYAKEHVPGALFFDIDEIADTDSGLPHMLPTAAKFSSRMRKMGIGDGSRIVVYDTKGLFSAARVWWMFRVMGKDDVAVLDGGFPKWKAEGRPIEDVPPMPRSEKHFTVRANAGLIRDMDDVKAILKSGSAQLVDARPAGRFEGRDAEPRPGLRLGHIPGARNVPFSELVQPDGTMKSSEDIARVFTAAGLDLSKPVVASCGSGVTAALLALGLAGLDYQDTAVYDGSWAEWGREDGGPVETGKVRGQE